MKQINGITVTDRGDMVAEGLKLRWTRDPHYLAGNRARRYANSGTLWHELPKLQECVNTMPNGFMCNGHPMLKEDFIKLVHERSLK